MWAWKVWLAVVVCVIGAHSSVPACSNPPCEGREYPTSPRTQVRVNLKVLKQEPVEGPRGVAVLSMNEGTRPGNKSLSWGKNTSHSPAGVSLPRPVVTIASRLLYDDEPQGGDEERDRDWTRNRNRERGRSSLSGDPQPRELEYDPVPEGDPYRTDTTLAEPTLLAWAGAVVSLLQPTHFPLGEYLLYTSKVL
ncbi:hypothetical protein Pcinc_032542 [Petrolisthes cinctipes]|uniref:Uncharacterized protein n=1 Tax=Petrolisthes cinctipes TaxID=88211 RepID=A0AAE1K376_PETCI|nr:hypothetical protein Pcinc_032542 [Petrolisthes cinctipes]